MRLCACMCTFAHVHVRARVCKLVMGERISRCAARNRFSAYACVFARWEGKGPQRGFQKRLGRCVGKAAKAAQGGYCRLGTPLKLAVAVKKRASGP